MAKGTILLLSGGVDSTCLLWALLNGPAHHLPVRCLSVNYGQRHLKEIDAARKIARAAKVEYFAADLSSVQYLLKGSSQTSDEVAVPKGHYTEESMKATVVPNRNMILLSLATAWAVSTQSGHVAYAAHSGDHSIYPDCRPEFANVMELAMCLCDSHKVKMLRPFIDKSKAQLVAIGAQFGAPFHLTWSCYEGKERHCGECGTCVERKEAFILAKVPDPTYYEA